MRSHSHRLSRTYRRLGVIVAMVLGGATVAWAQDPYAQEKTPRWAKAFDAGANTILTSPAVGRDHTIYVAGTVNTTPPSSRVIAVRPDGSEKWKDPFILDEEVADISPVLSADSTTLYIGSTYGVLRAINTETGKERWNFNAGHDFYSIWAPAAVGADGTVYVGATGNLTDLDSIFWALSPVDGTPLWWVPSAGAVLGSPAIAADGTVYFAGGKQLYAVSHDGQVKWTFPFADEIWVAPAIAADGTIYVGSNASEFVAISPEGKEKWRVPIRAGGGAAIGPDDTIYVGTIEPDFTGKVYALTPAGKNRPNWPISLPASVTSVPAIRADGVILFGCTDKGIRAVNTDGSMRWTTFAFDKVNSSPVIDTDGWIYVGAGKFLYAFRGSGAPLSEYASWPMYNRDILHQSQAAAPVNGGLLVNLATRGQTGPGNPLIAGFVLSGTDSESLLVRAVGPSLRQYGLSNPLPNPVLTIYTPPSFFFLGNDDWERENETDPASLMAASAHVGAFPLEADSKDAAVLASFAPTLNYTEVIESVDQNSGVSLAELYDMNLDPGSSRLMNVSTRGFVGSGDKVLIAGFVIGGEGRMRVLIRGVGQGLRRFDVNGWLSRPTISVYDSAFRLVDSNTGWTSRNRMGDLAGAAALVGAFSLEATSTDSAMILSLAPGAYTVHLSGVGGETGVGLVEVYALPH